MRGKPHARPHLDPTVRAHLVAEFRERWARAGYPSLVHHILGNMSEAHGIPLGVLKEIARSVRAEGGQAQPVRPVVARPPGATAPVAIVDGSNLAWARTSDDGHPRLDNLALARTALAERGYQALVVVDAALRHQLSLHDAGELDRQIQAQEVIQAPAATDGDLWVLSLADHHGAPVVSNDRFEEHRADYPWINERRVAVVFVEHAALLQGEALDGSGRPPTTPAALREEIARLRQAAAGAQARAEDVAALRGRLARLEGRLAREQARSAELQAEVARTSALLAEERRAGDALRQEIQHHPEQLSTLSRELAAAQEEAATLRGQRDALQARVRDLERQVQQHSSRRSEERGAAATRSDLDALRTELRGEIRDLARAIKEAQSPLPRILAMTREVREAVTGVQKSQGQTAEALERLEQASESLAITTDYLVALAEEDADEELADETEAEGAEADAEEPGPGETTEDGGDWQAEFGHIEAAWLAGRRVGDPHEAINFLHLVSDLRLDGREPSAILEVFERFRARAGGERFSYCPLHGAVHLVRTRKPSLDNPLVLVRYRELLKLPPCPDLEACPGAGHALSELLEHARS